MKTKEYVSPEMEIVKITEKFGIMAVGSDGRDTDTEIGGTGSGDPFA